MRVPFDIKYRPQIESGEYKVITRAGEDVKIICWERRCLYPIVCLHGENDTLLSVTENGMVLPDGRRHYNDLLIVKPESKKAKRESNLTWQDVRSIVDIADMMRDAFEDERFYTMGEQDFFEEILRRFES